MGYILLRPSISRAKHVPSDDPEDKKDLAYVRLDAGTITGKAHGQTVDVWQDQTRREYHASQGDPLKFPTYVDDGDHPALRFSGSEFLTLGKVMGAPSDYTIIAVAYSRNPNKPAMLMGAAGASNLWGVVGVAYNGYDLTDTLPESFTDEILLRRPKTFLVTLKHEVGVTSLRIDGQDVAVTGEAGVVAGAEAFCIGASGLAGENTWDGDIYEVLVYRTGLTAKQISIIEDDLKTKYSIA